MARTIEYFDRKMNRKPLKEKTELTLKSIDPQRMTNVIPMATKPMMLAVRAKLARFSNVRKTGLISAPITTTATRPMNGLPREAIPLAASNVDAAFMLPLRYRLPTLWKISAPTMIPALIISEYA